MPSNGEKSAVVKIHLLAHSLFGKKSPSGSENVNNKMIQSKSTNFPFTGQNFKKPFIHSIHSAVYYRPLYIQILLNVAGTQFKYKSFSVS